MQDELKLTLKSLSSNPSLITDTVVGEALNDTEEIVGLRLLEKPFVLDIAVYRFFIRINAKAPESVKESYKSALSRLKVVPFKKSSGRVKLRVGERDSVWM